MELENPITRDVLRDVIKETMVRSSEFAIDGRVWGHDATDAWVVSRSREVGRARSPHTPAKVFQSVLSWMVPCVLSQVYQIPVETSNPEIIGLVSEFGGFDGRIRVGDLYIARRDWPVDPQIRILTVALLDKPTAMTFKLKYPLA